MTQVQAGQMWVLSAEEAERTIRRHPAAESVASPGSVVAFALPDAPLPPGLLETLHEVLSSSTRPSLMATEVLEALTRDLGALGDGMLLQVGLTAQRLRDIDAEFGMLTSDLVARRAGSTARNTSATPTRWAREGKVFTVDIEGKHLYPAFQFDPGTGKPLPAIGEVATAYGPASGTSLTLWFCAPNGHLDDRRPVDLLATDPSAVVDAAGQARTPSV